MKGQPEVTTAITAELAPAGSKADRRRHGFALVFGGGGAVAAASCCGALRALEEVAGIAPDDARVAIGTSAGSVVAADVRAGRSYAEMIKDLNAEEGAESFSIGAAWKTTPELVRRVIGSTWIIARSSLPFSMRTPEPPGILKRAFPGSMMAIPDANWVARFPAEWPTKELWVVASDLESGRRVVLSQNTVDQREVTLRKAVQASCAVPGLYAPVRIGGRRLVDGGVRSVTNLDLVVRSGCRAAIAFAPMGFDRREPPGYVKSAQRVRFNRQIDSEAARVRRAGMSLLVLRPSASELRHHKYNILSRSGNDRVMEAAYDATVARLATDSARRILERIKEDADIAGGRNNR